MRAVDQPTAALDVAKFVGTDRFFLRRFVTEPGKKSQTPKNANNARNKEADSPGRSVGKRAENGLLSGPGLQHFNSSCERPKNDRGETRSPPSAKPQDASRASALSDWQPARLNTRHVWVG